MSQDEQESPNILLVIVDDLGSYQLGCYGSRFFETPHLDLFAQSGVRFERSYATSPVCSPARASLYTGKHPARLHLTNYIPGTEPANPRLLTPDWQRGLPIAEKSIGRIFKDAGYETAHFGKWHLAEDYNYKPNRPMDPESHGFDELMVTKKPKAGEDPETDTHKVEKLTKRTIEFLRRPHDRPFLCVLAHNAIHRPEMAPAELVERFESKPIETGEWRHSVLAAMTFQVDQSFGRLMDTLREEGLAENTIVVFTSDHGAMGRSDERKPWRGAKADLYEAGVRVPFLVRDPRIKNAGRKVSDPVLMTDLYPTLLDLAGVPSPDEEIDGVSLVPWLRNELENPPHDKLFWHFPHYHHFGLGPCGSMVQGKFKLIEWFESSIGNSGEHPGYELFDLEEDPGEEYDLSEAIPGVRDDMAASLDQWRKRIGAQEMTLNNNFDPSLEGQRAKPPVGDAEAKTIL